jgi:hypothetical protein
VESNSCRHYAAESRAVFEDLMTAFDKLLLLPGHGRFGRCGVKVRQLKGFLQVHSKLSIAGLMSPWLNCS